VWDNTALSATQVSNHYNAAAGGNYDATVLGDSPTSYWKLNESSGTTFADATTGNDAGAGQILQTNGSYIGNVTLGIPGANSGDNAITLDGSTGYVSTLTVAPNPQGQQFTEEIWFKTTTTQGGTLMGFNDAFSGVPGNWDRTFYMTNSGTVRFGIWNGSGVTTIGSPSSYNDGNWHYAVGVCTAAQQLILYIDGSPVASSATGINDNSGWGGYWHVGYNNYASNWTSPPSDYFFAGTVDEAAVYTYALSATQVNSHYLAR